jgi:hypothetical protein
VPAERHYAAFANARIIGDLISYQNDEEYSAAIVGKVGIP